MKRNLHHWLFALSVIAVAGAIAYDSELPPDTEEAQLVQAPVTYELVEEKVIDLPEDGGAYYLTLFVDRHPEADADSRRLLGWFASDPRLAGLKTQCHTKVIARGEPIFAARYANRLASPVDLPAVSLQKPSGHVVYRRHKSTMPDTPTQMANEISSCFPRPKPDPTPKPDVDVDVTVVPSLADVGGEQESTQDPTTLLAILGALLAGGGGVASQWKKSNP